MDRAVPDSLATDTLGAWDNVYKYIIPARALDRDLYERALLKLVVGSDCGANPDRAGRLSCAANDVADAASGLTFFPMAIELRRDAVAYAEHINDRDPEPLINRLITLALEEQSHGGLAGAEYALERIEKLVAIKPDFLHPHRRFTLMILKAKLADSKLDDDGALNAITEAVEILKSASLKAAIKSNDDYIDPGPFEELAKLHIRGRFCQACGTPIAKPIKDWLELVLSGKVHPVIGTEFPPYEQLLLALSAPPGSFSGDKLLSYAQRYKRLLTTSGMHPDAQRALPPRASEIEVAKQFALSNLITGSTDAAHSPFGEAVSIFRMTDQRLQVKLLRKALKTHIDGFLENGGDKDVPPALDNISQFFQIFGFRKLNQTTLEILVAGEAAKDKKIFAAEKRRMANIYAPAFARLASARFESGDSQAALKSFSEAEQIAGSKLRQEYLSGGARAIFALREFAPTLRLIAQKRSEIAAPRGISRNGTGHDALFRALQTAVLGETALTLAVADQRRFLSDESLRDLRRRHLEAVATAERAAWIAEYRYEPGDVDGALAKARKAAEDRRDALARDFTARVPTTFQSVADIEPVPLAEAAGRLADGEALTLLHVGSHGIHGFLLDGTGQSFAWRSVVRHEAVDTLVRTLRSGGDVSGGPFPPFPFADAAKLYDLVFGPVRDRLGAYRKLVVIGDGPLQAMPYSILLTKAVETPPKTPEKMREAGLPWLIRSHAIALMPSVRSLVAQRSATAEGRATKPLLGIGDPKVADAGSTVRSIDVAGAFGSDTGLADVATLRQLASLPETADELRAIAKLVDADEDSLLLGERASERTIRSMTLSDYKMVAFATHGALAGEVTGTREPGLVLTPPEQASREDDGFLALSEIADLRLDADLVLLSACNTGRSDGRPRAEGLSGLARGFFSAGARSLVVTHWYIPSESAPAVTAGLIAQRRQRPEIDWAEAHRAATLALIDKEGPAEWAHPAYWGGFAVVGVMPLTTKS